MKNFKLFTLALAALTIVSCSKDGVTTLDKDGQKAYATFSVKLPSPRALGDISGTAVENTITDCKVLIFGKDGVFSQEVVIDPVKLTADVVEISTGLNYFVTIINGASRNITKDDFLTVTLLDEAVLANLEAAYKENDPDKDVDVLMTSKKYSQTIKVSTGSGDSKENPIAIPMDVERAISKAFVRKGENGIALTDVLDGSTLEGTPQFAINGVVTKAATFQLFADSPVGLIKNHAAREVKFETAVTGSAITPPLNYVDLALYTGGVNIAGAYMLENIAGRASLNGNATMVYIKAQITPSQKFNDTDAAIAKDATYYRMEMKDNTMKLFSTKAAADKYYTDNKDSGDADVAPLNDKVYEHLKGMNYYRVLFRYFSAQETTDVNYAQMVYSVVRNNLYDIHVNKIINWGAPNDGADLVDPTQPIDDVAFVNVEITVKDWSIKTQQEDLE